MSVSFHCVTLISKIQHNIVGQNGELYAFTTKARSSNSFLPSNRLLLYFTPGTNWLDANCHLKILVKQMLHAYGDPLPHPDAPQEPLPETVRVLDDILTDFI